MGSTRHEVVKAYGPPENTRDQGEGLEELK